MQREELRILRILDSTVYGEYVSAVIDKIAQRVESKLVQDQMAPLAWEPIPLNIYSGSLPDIIRSSWVFVIRAGINTGDERHPNSHQRMMSYRGSGNLEVWNGERWCSNLLISEPDACTDSKWVSIPPNTWHRAIAIESNWVVVSFHTAPENELIEERTDPTDIRLIHQRRYLDELK